MNVRSYMRCILAALLATCISAGDMAFGAGLTAKADLAKVTDAGKKWKNDAVLVSLSSVKVRPDGSASEWKYSFYSPSTKKRCVITATASGVRTKEVNLGYSTEPLGEFIDSDKAMQEAKKNGLKGKDLNMAVKFQGSGAKAAAYWIVNGGFSKGDVSVFLAAKTGKFSSRNVME